MAGKSDELVTKLREHGPLAATKTGRAKVKSDEDGLKPFAVQVHRYAQAENSDSCAEALETDAAERVKHDKALSDQRLERMSKKECGK